jgi:ankyrin repeat protein
MNRGGDRHESYRRHQRLTGAFRSGDMAAAKAALGWPESFPNTPLPMEYAAGDWPLVTAITLSPLRFIRQLLDQGANPNFEANGGFPSLMSALDSPRADCCDVVALLLRYGARTDQRGVNDWTPLHYAVARRNLGAVQLLVEHGADPNAKTRIDDCSSALEDAIATGFTEAVAVMQARPKRSSRGAHSGRRCLPARMSAQGRERT